MTDFVLELLERAVLASDVITGRAAAREQQEP
jgi:hypothetical protein